MPARRRSAFNGISTCASLVGGAVAAAIGWADGARPGPGIGLEVIASVAMGSPRRAPGVRNAPRPDSARRVVPRHRYLPHDSYRPSGNLATGDTVGA
jgi:hypothetical protein